MQVAQAARAMIQRAVCAPYSNWVSNQSLYTRRCSTIFRSVFRFQKRTKIAGEGAREDLGRWDGGTALDHAHRQGIQ